MLKRTVTLLTVLCAVFISTCSCKDKPKPNGPTPPDTLVPPKGMIKFSLIQYGDTLGTLDIYEDRHNIVLENALHVDSLKMGREIAFEFILPESSIHFQGVDPFVFCFIQSINPNIGYNDFCIIRPNWFGGKTKLNFADIRDSIFYCEAFFCMFDFDDENTGRYAVKIITVNDDLSFTRDTIEIDAALHTVVLDSAVCLRDIAVASGPDIYMNYWFWGEYETRESRVFLLTKYGHMEGLHMTGYLYDHSGIFYSGQNGLNHGWTFRPMDDEIPLIVAFWPVIPTKYTNHFWKKIYTTR